MDVEPVLEGLFQGGDIRHIGEDAQLDLRIVGGNEDVAVFRDECFADLAAFFRPYRDVLEVRVRGGEAARLGAGHHVACVDAAGFRLDRGLQRFGIGRAQLRQRPPVDDGPGQGVALIGEFFEHVGIGLPGAGLCFLAAGQVHLVEQDFAELLGRADVELAARLFMRLRLEARHALCKIGREA